MSETNGNPPTADQLREELQRLRLQTRLKVAQQQAKLVESYYYPYPSLTGGWGELVDPMDRYRDGDRLVVPMGLPSVQDGKKWPFIRSEQDLADTRAVGRLLATLNPVAVGVLEGLVDFLVGEGMLPRAASRHKERAQENGVKDLSRQVQDVIDDFVEANAYDELQQELVHRSRAEGEYALRYFPVEGEPLQVRLIEPEQITENGAPVGAGWSMGVRHFIEQDPETGYVFRQDIQTPVAYWVKYDAQDRGEEVPAEQIQHVKVNVYRNTKRGLTDFFCTSDALEGVRKLLRNLREGAAIQAAIAGIREHQATEAKVAAFQDTVKTQLQHTDPVTQRTVNYQKFDPGTILDIGRGQKYTPPPWMNQGAPNHVMIAQAVYRLIGNRWRMPEYMVSGDSSNANFASTLVSGAPFSRWSRRNQKFYKRRFAQPVWKAVEFACADGRITADYATVRELIDIQLEAPSPDIANELELAQVDNLDIASGVLSVQTRRQRRGLDDEQERTNRQQEPPVQAPAPPASDPPAARGGLLDFFARQNTDG